MSCHADDVFHFDGEPQRCLYCLDPLRAVLIDVDVVRCASCHLRYSLEVLCGGGTERILGNPDRFHIERLDTATFADPHPVPYVVITDLDTARSLLAARGDPARGDPARGDPARGDPARGEQ